MNVWVVRLLSVLALVLLGTWIVTATEWADTEVPTPASGAAKTDPLYAVQGLMRELGMQVTKRESLDAMPPAQARLVLASGHWDMFPEREARLRAWVEQGGHLVMPTYLVDEDMLKRWIPLVEVDWKRPARKGKAASEDNGDGDSEEEEAEAEDGAPAGRKRGKLSRAEREQRLKNIDCHAVVEPDNVAASFAGSRSFRLCAAWVGTQYVPADSRQPPLWAAQGPRGTEAVRVRVGRGTVTVMPWGLLRNNSLLRADNALFAATAFQASAGGEIWFVAQEAREPFLKWLWHKGWVALLAAALALAVALWRAAVRFGPLAPSAGTHRRSMAEQVRGTAGFLHMHGAGALHAAQLRALDESAARHLRRYRQLDAAARAGAIAKATGLDAAMLARAMSGRVRRPEAMAVDLEVLETARRRIEAEGASLSSSSSIPLSSSS